VVLLKIPWRYVLKCQKQFAIRGLAKKQGGLSERKLAHEAGVSRAGLRSLMAHDQNVTLHSVAKVAAYLGRDVHLLATSDETNTELSTLAVSYKVMSHDFPSWKIHFMDFVDEFRRTLDPQLFLLAPPRALDVRLKSLLASIVVHLCEESQMDPPSWAKKTNFLDEPWFVSGMQSLKAMAILESPLPFRRNNIFVLENFLERV
jgi:hypothetical protein